MNTEDKLKIALMEKDIEFMDKQIARMVRERIKLNAAIDKAQRERSKLAADLAILKDP